MFRAYSVFFVTLFGCQYPLNQLPGKTRFGNDLLCVKWDMNPAFSLTLLPSLTLRPCLASSFLWFPVKIYPHIQLPSDAAAWTLTRQRSKLRLSDII